VERVSQVPYSLSPFRDVHSSSEIRKRSVLTLTWCDMLKIDKRDFVRVVEELKERRREKKSGKI
jgi:hypothetical protein